MTAIVKVDQTHQAAPSAPVLLTPFLLLVVMKLIAVLRIEEDRVRSGRGDENLWWMDSGDPGSGTCIVPRKKRMSTQLTKLKAAKMKEEDWRQVADCDARRSLNEAMYVAPTGRT
jgi:hypothetical protein